MGKKIERGYNCQYTKFTGWQRNGKINEKIQKQLSRGVKKEFLKISQNLQGSTCAGVSFLTGLATSLRCFHLNFVKFLRTAILLNICEQLLLKIMSIRIQLYNNWHNQLQQYPYISRTNFAVLFSSKNIKRESSFQKMQLIWTGLFSSSGKLLLCISHLYFSFLWYELSLYKSSIIA